MKRKGGTGEGGRKDISGNRLDNRHKHPKPKPCTGTRWLVAGSKTLVQQSFRLAAPLPGLALVSLSRGAAGIWLKLWGCVLCLPPDHQADQQAQEVAEGQQHPSFAALALVRNCEMVNI